MYHQLVISFLILLIDSSISFECPVKTSCACAKNAGRGYDINCPDMFQNDLQISFAFDESKELQIDCLLKDNFMNYLSKTYISMRSLMYDMDNLDLLRFQRCSLPKNVTIMDLMRSLSVKGSKKIIISYSVLMNLQRKDLEGLEEVEKLQIAGNTMDNIPNDLIYDLIKLQEIDISRNSITLPQKFFTNSKLLRKAELAMNKLPGNTTGMFDNLTELKSLNMWSMGIEKLDKDIFHNLIKLETLDLSYNKLYEVPQMLFSGNLNLKVLYLRRNMFEALPEGLFDNNKLINNIRLNENRALTTLPGDLFSNLTELEFVDIVKTKVSKLPESMFYGAHHLKELDLSSNLINELPKELFRDQKHLEKLYLQNNQLKSLPKDLFSNMGNLKILNLDNNQIKLTRDDFHGLFSLHTLSIRNNGLQKVHRSIFGNIPKVENLDLSYNDLTLSDEALMDLYGNTSPIDLINLKMLNLSHNKISEIFVDWKLTRMQLVSLDLSYNNFEHLDYSDLDFIQRETIYVNLTYNKIKHIDLSHAEQKVEYKDINPDKATQVNLAGNQFDCDCRMYDLYRYMDLTMDPKVRSSLNILIGNEKCAGPPRMANNKIEDIKSTPFYCELTHEVICENNSVACYFQPSSRTFIADYSFSKLTKPPVLSSLLDNDIILKTEVILRGNEIEEMPTKGMGYEKCTVLDMSFNKITHIEWLPDNLVELLLNDNNITSLDSTELELFNKTHLRNISLHNNPFKCDCETVNLTKHLQDNFKKFHRLHNITCEESHLELALLTRDELCPTNNLAIILSVTVLALCCLLSLCTLLFYRFNMEIKVWLYAHQTCLWLVTEEELDKDKIYDAFISYSHKDEDFIISEMIEKLEKGPIPYKLCLHFRNWQPGEFITTNIANSVAESRRTIVILSKNFLQSEWGKMEFRTAHKEALSEKRARVIVILLGDIPMDDLDAEWKAYLNTNTYVKWGDPWFWDKLRYALPHSKFPKNFPIEQIIIGEETKFKTVPEKIIICDDKLDLMEPTTPNNGTTPPCDKIHFDPMIKGALNVTLVNGTLINNALNSGKLNIVENR